MPTTSSANGNDPKSAVLRPTGKLTRNASEVTVELIKEAIFQGRLKPGDRLKEEELAAELGTSRTPVREALLVLQAEGMAVSTPNRGAIVRAYTLHELVDLYQLRALLEGFAAQRAATNLTDEQIESLRECCDRFSALREKHDRIGISRENLWFHNTITEGSKTVRLPEVVRMVCEVPLVYQSFNWYTEEEAAESDYSHRQILMALISRDPQRARIEMERHMLVGRDFLLKHVRDGDYEIEQDDGT